MHDTERSYHAIAGQWNPIALSVEDARASTLAAVMPPNPNATETVPLVSAAGRVLARDVTAGLSMPRWPNRAVDGYAMRLVLGSRRGNRWLTTHWPLC